MTYCCIPRCSMGSSTG
ncbi:hypothetical protein ZEAMMB73_Zm00001d019252 [Zea mays]|uniref:Uncharacterized protein n=1 Tax=Zea mays TaxID=4577 RepID=A0A1D6HWE3_MAIZE|nr:hypothetical protein ZEAMMB73_Zm00001d019252 [Zea mays]ONM52553.1 hypothetical protein ZEAMMB73_Zm00001d019252 [Zea mays]ONM52568.1 hypothetical protein ZEAMMB73_Zm00001d019252 [Zea mays]